MTSYLAYGLRIDSELSLPELAPSEHSTPDVRIYRRTLSEGVELRDRWTCTCDTVQFEWADVGRFRVQGGTDIHVDVPAGVDERLVRLPLLGTVLAALLHQRGFLVLHASAVSIGEKVVALVGHKGWGKSTTAAALHAQGHPLVTDDLLAVRPGTGAPHVVSGFPQFKLMPEAAVAALGDDPATLPELSTRVSKRARRAGEGFRATGAWPLAAIYVLDRGPQLELTTASTQQAFVELLRYSYNLMQLRELQEGGQANLFSRYAHLAEHVPVKYLRREDNLQALPDIASLLETDVLTGAADADRLASVGGIASATA